jgi:hypothetical protein
VGSTVPVPYRTRGLYVVGTIDNFDFSAKKHGWREVRTVQVSSRLINVPTKIQRQKDETV